MDLRLGIALGAGALALPGAAYADTLDVNADVIGVHGTIAAVNRRIVPEVAYAARGPSLEWDVTAGSPNDGLSLYVGGAYGNNDGDELDVIPQVSFTTGPLKLQAGFGIDYYRVGGHDLDGFFSASVGPFTGTLERFDGYSDETTAALAYTMEGLTATLRYIKPDRDKWYLTGDVGGIAKFGNGFVFAGLTGVKNDRNELVGVVGIKLGTHF